MSGAFRAGLVGWPVSHSLSPAIHSLFMRHFGVDGTYELYPVEPGNLTAFVTGPGSGRFTGLNITVPHKIAAMKLCDSLSPSAESAGAVNTLVFEPEGLRGCNTDITGFRAMTRDLPTPFFVMGRGGAAAAVSAAINSSEVILLARGEVIPEANRPAMATVVNATPLGWNDDDVFPFEIPEGWCFADLNYNPCWRWRNRLNTRVITGEKMLVEQAAESFRLWTGYTPGEDLKRKTLERIRGKLHEDRNNPQVD